MKRQHAAWAHTLVYAALALWLLQVGSAATAQVSVVPGVTTNLGVTTFDFAIANSTPNDLVIVTIGVPAFPGAIFDLETPTGFVTNFDSGLGLVDFLADTDSFAAGSTLSGFKFSSHLPPGPSQFTALDLQGNLYAG